MKDTIKLKNSTLGSIGVSLSGPQPGLSGITAPKGRREAETITTHAKSIKNTVTILETFIIQNGP